jgi:Zn-dependent protease/CBS domain-containing protein
VNSRPKLADQSSAIAGTVGTIRLFGVPVRFHFTFVLLLIFLTVTGLGDKQSGTSYVVYVLALFLSVLLHELGHAMIARLYGYRTFEIVMFPIGGVARMEKTPKPKEELWIALAGPAVNIVIAAVMLGFLYYRNQIVGVKDLINPTDANLIQRIAFGNVILALFNLIPAFPMDGGRVLRAILARFKSEDEATRIAAWAGRMLAISMGFYGLIWMQFMLVFIAFFVYLGAAQEGAAAIGRSLTHGIPVSAAMITEFHTLPHGSTIRDAANLLLATSQQDFPVVHGTQVIGLLPRNSLMRALASEGAEAYVSSAIDRNCTVLPPDMDLAEALPFMVQAGSCALVMKDDRLLGLLTAENLSEFLMLRRFGMEPAQTVKS